DLYTSLLSDYRNNEMASLEGAVQRWNKRLRAYFSGFRAASVTTEALNRYVDRCRSQELANATINRDLAALKRAYNLALKAGRIRLNAGETKSGEGRVVKLTQDVFVLLQACVAGKDADDFVFTRENGKPIKGFRAVWKKLTTAAGAPGLLLHDLRRSAVRNMV